MTAFGGVRPRSSIQQSSGPLVEPLDQVRSTSQNNTTTLKRRIDKIQRDRRKWAEQAFDGTIPADIAREKQEQLTRQLVNLDGELKALEAAGLDTKTTLHAVLDLLSDPGSTYSTVNDQARRAYNQSWFTRIYIDIHENDPDRDLTYDTERTPFSQALDGAHTLITTELQNTEPDPERSGSVLDHGLEQVRSSSNTTIVDAGGLKPNTWQRFERLSSAWKQAKIGAGDEPQGAVEDESGVVVNPRRRARTPLTNRQVDAIRTARANGESVVSICRRFDVHRMTVWTYTNGSHRASK